MNIPPDREVLNGRAGASPAVCVDLNSEESHPCRQAKRPPYNQKGSTLVISVFIIALLAVLMGAAFDFTRGTAYVARRGRDLTAAQALADGALEVAFKKWQVYMAANQSSSFATSAGGTFAAAADFKTKIGDPTVTLLGTNAASSGFKVTEINISPVDQADNPRSYQNASYATVGPLSNVPGWIAKAYSYRARAVVRSISDPSVVVSVSRYFQQAEASLFQAMLFFQNDLELHPGPNMTLTGLIHTNSNLYAVAGSGGGLTFNSNVSYVGNQSTFAPAAQHPTNFAANPNGYAEGVTQTLYNQESGNWNAYKNPVYAASANSQLSNISSALDPLGLNGIATDASNPNDTGTHEIIERPKPAASGTPGSIPADTGFTDLVASHRLYNAASLRVLINRNASTNGGQLVHVYRPGATLADSTEITPTTGSAAPNIANQIIAAITPDTGTGDITDFREGRAINTDTIDVSKLTPALNAYASTTYADGKTNSYNGVLYVSDVTNADASGQTGNSDAIRLQKGGVLPGTVNGVPPASGVEGMTVVSDGAVYVQGDYNTGTTYGPNGPGGAIVTTAQPVANLNVDPSQYTVSGYTQKPAAVMGDAVMILSNSWLDGNSSQQLSTRIATPTTFNAALVSGQVLTNDGGNGKASGGAHNFPRFLEDWSGKNFTYHGSMCELYGSTHFKGTYGKSNVYGAPNRRWFFDNNFLLTPPPGNLRSTGYIRGRWIRNKITDFEPS